MAAYIKTLQDATRENTIYPRTKSTAVYRDDNVTLVEDTLVSLETGLASNLEEAKEYTDVQIAAISVPDVSGPINTHNIDTTAHADIREVLGALETAISGKADSSHNHDSAYDTKGAADTALATAKSYADSAAATVKNDLLNGAGEAYDTLKELGDLITENVDAIDALETVATGKQDKITGIAGDFVVIGTDGNTSVSSSIDCGNW